MSKATCVQCGRTLARRRTGRPARFCSNACRCAAYRRRERGLPEDLKRWRGPRGRLRLQEKVNGQDDLQRHQATAREVEALLGEALRPRRRR